MGIALQSQQIMQKYHTGMPKGIHTVDLAYSAKRIWR